MVRILPIRRKTQNNQSISEEIGNTNKERYLFQRINSIALHLVTIHLFNPSDGKSCKVRRFLTVRLHLLVYKSDRYITDQVLFTVALTSPISK